MASSWGSAGLGDVFRIYWDERGGRREVKSDVKTMGSTHGLHLKLYFLSAGEANGIPCVAVKCVDIRRNTSGEGGSLVCN